MSNRKITINLEKIATDLEKRKTEISGIRASSQQSRDIVELDQSKVGRLSRMDALQSQAMSLESERRRQVELSKIETTLTRLQNGNYGYCLRCDEEIQLKRLELDPTVTLCIECATKKGT
ncbi:conjugal transfer protein TraR [Kiloniella litopenaei]|uniref:Conjugal transfer protein TraR n=1 Tax=Kiloniella litopenaei TaxID=1549748 RepID=A0A0M2RDF2_9PROT|nr:TraR/DksA C4-type zinc finger protein [Kiloniella litopenaei]KKJ77588.1 conjugal transfer protein TraR [Kiloniella litopenaei]